MSQILASHAQQHDFWTELKTPAMVACARLSHMHGGLTGACLAAAAHAAEALSAASDGNHGHNLTSNASGR